MKQRRRKAFKRCIALSLAIVMVATTYLYSAEGSLRAVETGDEQVATPTEKQQTQIVIPGKEEQTAEKETEKSLSTETKSAPESIAAADMEKADGDKSDSQELEKEEQADKISENTEPAHNAAPKDGQDKEDDETRTAKFFAQFSGGGCAKPRG